MDKLHALQIFASVANTGSFAKTSKMMGANPSTVSKAIDRLEKEIGFRLFQRSTRSLRLTLEGETYRDTVTHLLSELTACEEGIRLENETPKGKLKINTPVAYGRLYVSPIIPKFCQQYPDVEVELTLDDAYIDMIEKGYDISIRSGSLQDNRLIAQKLSSMDMVTIGSPKEADKLEAPLDKNSIEDHPWVQFRFKQSGKVYAIQTKQEGEITQHSTRPKFIADDGETLIEQCAAGIGFTQLPHFLVRDALIHRKVVPIMNTFTVENYGIYVIYAKRDFLPIRVRLFIDFLKQELKNKQETPDGTWAMALEPLTPYTPK